MVVTRKILFTQTCTEKYFFCPYYRSRCRLVATSTTRAKITFMVLVIPEMGIRLERQEQQMMCVLHCPNPHTHASTFFFTQPTTLWCTIYSSLSSSSDSKESSESGINRGTGSMARGDPTRLRVFWALFWYCHQGHGKSTVLPRPCQLQNLTPKSTSDVSPRYTSRHKCTWLHVGNGLNIKHRNSQSVTRFAHLLGLFLPWWFLQIMTQAVVSPDYDVRGTRFTTWQSS